MMFIPLVVFAFGLLIGSFLNVVILRMNTGRTVVKGRSKCARCNQTLAWHDLIPVFSFLGLRGKCRQCRTPISFQYPLVELTTAIVFVLLYARLVVPFYFGMLAWASFVFAAVVAALLIVITVYDLKHKIIPDGVVYPFILLSIASVVWKAIYFPGFAILPALAGGVVVALPFFLFWFFSKGKLMGFGDVKLALGMGWLLGIGGGMAALLLSFWFGGAVGLLLLALSRKHSMRSEVPFAPFMILAIFVVGVWGIRIATLFPLWS